MDTDNRSRTGLRYTISRHLRMLSIFYSAALQTELEYRANFVFNLMQSLFWLIWAALTVSVYFNFTDSVMGWSYHEVIIVMGLFFFVNGFRQMIIEVNLERLSDYIRLGTLDYVLLKPVSSQFMVSLRYIGVHNWSDPLLGVGLIVYALGQLHYVPSIGQIALALLMLIVGLLALYSISLLLQTVTIFTASLEQASAIIQGVLETGRFPVAFYRGILTSVLTVVIPVAIMTTFPAQALLGKLDVTPAVISAGISIGLFIGSALFWRYALRFYTGASA